MLSDRRQIILRALIEEYVSCAMPVGSRTLAEHYGLGVSPATIRNELSALEEQGYIVQPHTSAGRIPTDAGYRSFVDDILSKSDSADAPVDGAIAAKMKDSADALDGLMRKVSEELARLTDCLSIVGCMDSDSPSEAGMLSKKEHLGLSALMRKPEFQESSSLLPLMEVLEDDRVYFKVFDEANRSDGFSVCIGEENEDSSLVCVSVVAGSYACGDRQGVVAVIGPTRMNYSRVIGAVRAAQDVLDEK